MRIAIIDESASRAAVIHQFLASIEACTIFVVTERRDLIARISAIAPEIVLIDLANRSRDVLEAYFVESGALTRPISLFVDGGNGGLQGAAFDAGLCCYVAGGMTADRTRPIFDLAVRKLKAFVRLEGNPAPNPIGAR